MKEFSSIVTTDSSAFRARVQKKKKKLQVAVLTFIFVVKDWIIVTSSENGYRLLSYVCPQRKYKHPTVKFSFSEV